jgi:hypothetical protein
MGFYLHLDLCAAVAQRDRNADALLPPAARSDWASLRANGESALAAIEGMLPEHSDS